MIDPGWSRRRFLEMVGKAGGAAAVYETMVALGLMRVPEALAEPLPRVTGNHSQTVIRFRLSANHNQTVRSSR